MIARAAPVTRIGPSPTLETIVATATALVKAPTAIVLTRRERLRKT
jgi:hypothetical protein